MIAVVSIVVVAAIWSGATASPVGPVRSWRTVQSPDGTFTMRVPIGWQVTQRCEPSAACQMMIARSRWVHIYVDIRPRLAQSAGVRNPADADDTYQLLAALHDRARRDWSANFGEITEGRTSSTRLGGAPAMWSRIEFTDTEGTYKGETMVGLRATVVGGNASVLMAALAPERYWGDFEPVALDIFRSIRFAGRQPQAPGAGPRPPAR
ncbi:MAG TPA: hypothetical protein VM283_05405 [Armatimonadota bacterium]|nr:hypothetical protein [Armatimonadota bacterium]